MNAQIVKGNWNIAKGRLKKAFAQLTDNDLHYVEGQEDELVGRIQRRTGRSIDEIEKYFDDSTK